MKPSDFHLIAALVIFATALWQGVSHNWWAAGLLGVGAFSAILHWKVTKAQFYD